MLFDAPHEELSDEEIAAILRQSIAAAGRLSREADLFLAGVSAEHLVDGLRAAGLLVIRPVQWRLHRWRGFLPHRHDRQHWQFWRRDEAVTLSCSIKPNRPEQREAPRLKVKLSQYPGLLQHLDELLEVL
jgi:hypothetical protein